MGTIKITLETLYDILCTEKKMGDLQKLEYSFFMDVINYLKEKQALLERRSSDDELFAAGERQKLEYELRSIKRIVKEIYEKREKKIIDIALNRSKTNSDIIDTSAMLPEEKGFYSIILETLNFFREGILLNLFKGELPKLVTAKRIAGEFSAFSKFEPKPETQQGLLLRADGSSRAESGAIASGVIAGNVGENSNAVLASQEGSAVSNAENTATIAIVASHAETEKKEETQTEEKQAEEKAKKKVRFIRPMPSFVWKDMKVYGPFDIGEETDIFPEVAELLVRKGRAEIV